jgi:hypothetical protein
MATETVLYNTTSTIHTGYYPKQITRKFKTAYVISALLYIL